MILHVTTVEGTNKLYKAELFESNNKTRIKVARTHNELVELLRDCDMQLVAVQHWTMDVS